MDLISLLHEKVAQLVKMTESQVGFEVFKARGEIREIITLAGRLVEENDELNRGWNPTERMTGRTFHLYL